MHEGATVDNPMKRQESELLSLREQVELQEGVTEALEKKKALGKQLNTLKKQQLQRKDDAAKKKKKQAVGGFGSDDQDVSRSVASPLYSQGAAQGEGDHKPAWGPEMDEVDPI